MPKKVKYPLALGKIGDLEPTPDEKLELNKIFQKERYRELGRVVLLLIKTGHSKDEICALCEIEDRLFKRIHIALQSSVFLADQIKFSLERLQKSTINDTDEALVGEIVDTKTGSFNEDLINTMEGKLAMLIEAITPGKIIGADLDKIGNTFAKIFDKYRTATGQSNINVLGVQALITTGSDDVKRLEKLAGQVDKIQRLLKATGYYSGKNKDDEPTKVITGPTQTGQ